MIRVILADDHTIVRFGLNRLLQQEVDIEVIAEAGNGYLAIELAGKLFPDIVIMDIGMPDLNGIEATRLITAQYPEIKVIALSMHSGQRFIVEMFKAGAAGYLLKNCAAEELVNAIRIVNENKVYISPSISDVFVHDYCSTFAQKDSAFSVLTEREREVLQLLAEGQSTKAIAKKLSISPKTVEAHRLRLMSKLGMDSIAKLTKYAIQEGLTLPEP